MPSEASSQPWGSGLRGRPEGRSPVRWLRRREDGRELLGLDPGALPVRSSAGECTLLFPPTDAGVSFPTEILGTLESHRYTRRADFSSPCISELERDALSPRGMAGPPGAPGQFRPAICLVGAACSLAGDRCKNPQAHKGSWLLHFM